MVVMPLWDVEIEETRRLTVTVDATSRHEAKRLACLRPEWLDQSQGDTVHLEPGDASPQTHEAPQEVDCFEAAQYEWERTN